MQSLEVASAPLPLPQSSETSKEKPHVDVEPYLRSPSLLGAPLASVPSQEWPTGPGFAHAPQMKRACHPHILAWIKELGLLQLVVRAFIMVLPNLSNHRTTPPVGSETTSVSVRGSEPVEFQGRGNGGRSLRAALELGTIWKSLPSGLVINVGAWHETHI